MSVTLVCQPGQHFELQQMQVSVSVGPRQNILQFRSPLWPLSHLRNSNHKHCSAWLLQRVGSVTGSFSYRGRTYLIVQVPLGLEGQALVILQREHVGPDADGQVAGVHLVDLGVLADKV